MTNQKLEIKTNIQIQKPVQAVFEAIVDPAKMSNYFIADGSGRIEENKKLIWHFPEFAVDVPVRVAKVEQDKYISFYWEGAKSKELLVEMHLSPIGATDTLLTITEKEMENDDEGIKWLKSNTEGWANFSACLKAYLEYEINLRKGAFDFLKNKEQVVQK